MAGFKFTKKMKNRMKNDTAAIIAMAKSTTDCRESGSTSNKRSETEALITAAAGPKLVYQERTNL
jgi:hypothetical protein